MSKQLKLLQLLLLLLVSQGFLMLYAAAPEQASKTPNVIIIYADDMGFGDVGYNGSENISTPNIDKLAGQSVIFNQGYVSASVCAPSRAGLLTGQYQQRFGLGENCSASGWPHSPISQGSGIPDDQVLASELLKEKGYTTAMVGKWHLGVAESKRPNQKGFDYYYGFLNGSHSYYKSALEMGDKKGIWPLFDDNTPVTFDGYLTEVFTDKAVQFIEKVGEEPFFLYLAYNAVHHPWEVPDKYIERLQDIELPNRRKFAAMVLALDDGVGEIMKALEEQGIAENTVVVFISDNGSPKGQAKGSTPGDYMSSTGGLRGWKGDTYEGGIRVPFLIKWPGILQPGTYNKPVINLDILPTIASHLDLGTDNDFDGVNLLPFLTGKEDGMPHDILYWRRDDDYAIRKGDWKLCWNDRGMKDTDAAELFNLADDPREQHNLAAQFPELAKELQRIFDEWDSQLPDSKWWGAPKNRIRK
ncbi:sulfatase-like hydrolase/transferase [Carboxylicivirga mesophila]|uniref:Sulfatase-like hydrolase/transferase n=1 Tax=Carboxylicivirga mesophila TaxID=1166478 RepID=A0ABS5K5U8_9BACT|nr:sulfatase-like hydrolase/transferase [Carboxylicivirga mesophila]MBS2210282.1 sulfatase-like hydrolase/transferase [Carboxylicivirga mesophila]